MKPNLNPERSLSAKLESYTDNDPVFKKELISLMISNLRELQSAAQQAKGVVFEKAAHKTKSTITIIDDDEMNRLIHDLRNLLKTPKDIRARKKAEEFFQHIEFLIKCLEDEAPIQKAS